MLNTEWLAQRMVDRLYKKSEEGTLRVNNREWYVRFLERELSRVALLLITSIVAMPFGAVYHTALFALVLFSREYTGGYHAPNRNLCNLLSYTLPVIVGVGVTHIPDTVALLLSYTLLPLAISLLSRHAPVVHPNNVLKPDELCECRKRVRQRLCFWGILVPLSHVFHVPVQLRLVISIGLTTIAIFVLIAKIIKQEAIYERECEIEGYIR